MDKGKCKHFRGVQHDTCLAGIDWRTVTGGDSFGIANRMPCFKRNNSPAKCRHYVEPTDAEIQSENDAFRIILEKMAQAGPTIKSWREKLPIGKQEMIECPVCGGRLHLSQAECNGHVHGACETENCIRWME